MPRLRDRATTAGAEGVWGVWGEMKQVLQEAAGSAPSHQAMQAGGDGHQSPRRVSVALRAGRGLTPSLGSRPAGDRDRAARRGVCTLLPILSRCWWATDRAHPQQRIDQTRQLAGSQNQCPLVACLAIGRTWSGSNRRIQGSAAGRCWPLRPATKFTDGCGVEMWWPRGRHSPRSRSFQHRTHLASCSSARPSPVS